MSNVTTPAGRAFIQARDFCLRHRTDYDTAVREFQWPRLEEFNWALDYFDPVAAGNAAPALHVVNEDGTEHCRSFEAMSARSSQVANFLRTRGVGRGDCVLVMLGNEVALWESLLALMKLGAVASPATGLLTVQDIEERVDRGRVRHVIASGAHLSKFHAIRSGTWFPRHSSSSRRGTNRSASWPSRFWRMPPIALRRTSAFAGSSSAISRRRFRGRSAASSCGKWSCTGVPAANVCRWNSWRRI
jgi:hypothetical protein